MITIGHILKNTNSIEKFQLEFEEEDIKWVGISNLEQLKEEIIITNFDLFILDSRAWWFDEAKDLLTKRGVTISYFNDGAFKPTIEEMAVIINELKKEIEIEENKYSLNNIQGENIKPEIRVVEKIVEKVVEKVVYNTRDISKKIYTVISEDNSSFRDYYSINLGTYLSSLKNSKSIVIDITLTQNLINCVSLLKTRETTFTKELNPATIIKCCDLINSESETYLLRIEEGISKSLLKSLLFNLRDFENIIFCLDMYNKDIPVAFILALSNKVNLAIEPVYASGKKSLKILENIKDYGQINENIKIILTDIVEEIDLWKTLYRNMYEVFEFNRFDIFESMNKDKLLEGKKHKELFKRIIGIENEPRKTSFFRRRI